MSYNNLSSSPLVQEWIDAYRSYLTAAKQIWTPTTPYEGNKKGRKTSLDEVWDEVRQELSKNHLMTPRQVFGLLEDRYPNRFRKSQLTTIYDKVRARRHEQSN